jgi:hypothetical protein
VRRSVVLRTEGRNGKQSGMQAHRHYGAVLPTINGQKRNDPCRIDRSFLLHQQQNCRSEVQ